MRLDQITFTRFLAAISIVIFHYGKTLYPFNTGFLALVFEQANVGVCYFFILSGFIMIVAYANKPEIKFMEYMKNRFARIYPVYLFAILVLYFYNLSTQPYIDYDGFYLNILAIQAWVSGKSMSFNSPAWSLSVEFFFYAIFPFLLNQVYRKKTIKMVAIPILILWATSQWFFHWFLSSKYYLGFPSESHDFIYCSPLVHVNQFLIGNLAGLFFITRLKDKNRNYDIAIMACVVAMIIAFNVPLGLNYQNGLLAVLFVPLILFISLNTGKITAISKTHFLLFLGEISYGIYILQFPIFEASRFLFKGFHLSNPQMGFYLTIFTLIAISSMSYYCIESPLRKLIKNDSKKQQ